MFSSNGHGARTQQRHQHDGDNVAETAAGHRREGQSDDRSILVLQGGFDEHVKTTHRLEDPRTAYATTLNTSANASAVNPPAWPTPPQQALKPPGNDTSRAQSLNKGDADEYDQIHVHRAMTRTPLASSILPSPISPSMPNSA